MGQGPDEYRKPAEFFRRTCLTDSLKRLLIGAVQRLAKTGGDQVVQLQTNFGGGKTHSMLALYHLFSGSPAGELRMVAAVVHTPITLRDEIQNLPASHWRSIPVQPPYNGNLDVTLNVVRGNPLDVFLVDSSQMDVMKRTDNWTPIQGNVDFSAVKTTEYHTEQP